MRRRGNKITKSFIVFTLIIISFILLGSKILVINNVEAFELHMTRANGTLNYTQIALNFIETNYPDKTVEIISSVEYSPSQETGYIYSIIGAHLLPGDNKPFDVIEVSVRHDTLNVEMGRDQIERDIEEYWNSLPIYYQKCNIEARLSILSIFEELPNVTNPDMKNYSAWVYFEFEPGDYSIITELINNTGERYEDDYSHDGVIDSVKGNMTLEHIFEISNDSHVQSVIFFEIHPNNTNTVQTVILVSTAVCIPSIIVIGFIRTNRKKQE